MPECKHCGHSPDSKAAAAPIASSETSRSEVSANKPVGAHSPIKHKDILEFAPWCTPPRALFLANHDDLVDFLGHILQAFLLISHVHLLSAHFDYPHIMDRLLRKFDDLSTKLSANRLPTGFAVKTFEQASAREWTFWSISYICSTTLSMAMRFNVTGDEIDVLLEYLSCPLWRINDDDEALHPEMEDREFAAKKLEELDSELHHLARFAESMFTKYLPLGIREEDDALRVFMEEFPFIPYLEAKRLVYLQRMIRVPEY